MSAVEPTATMRPPFMATPPFSITRRSLSMVTTVPPRTIRSTTVFLFCAIVMCEAALKIKSTAKKRFLKFIGCIKIGPAIRDHCGSAAAQCGKALPYRCNPSVWSYACRLRLQPLVGIQLTAKVEAFPPCCAKSRVSVTCATRFFQEPRIERPRQQIPDRHFFALATQIRQNDLGVLGELPDDLPAGAARRRQ